MDKSKLLTVLAATGIAFAKPTFADFSVNNNQSSGALENNQDYGHATTTGFKKAIEGNDMSFNEKAEVDDMLPARYKNSFYGRFGVHLSKSRFSSIKNKSLGANAASIINEKVNTDNGRGMEIAIGKTWDNWRTEVEYLLLDDFEYKPNPVFVGGGLGMNAKIKSQVILINGYYELLSNEHLKPFIMFGIGVASNEADTTFNGRAKTRRILGSAYTFGLGARVKLINQFYLDLAWRYANLGKFTLYDGASTKLKGNRSMSAISVGLSFLFN